MDRLAKKYAELFYRFSSHKEFEPLVKRVREQFLIDTNNPNAFLNKKSTDREGEKWEDAIYDILFAIIPKYMEAEGDFLFSATEKYIIGAKEAVEDYLSNSVLYSYGVSVFLNLDAKHLSKFGNRYKRGVFIYISPHTSKTDLIFAIDKKWAEIKNELQKKNKNDKNLKKLLRVRTHRNKERDNLIFGLYQKTRTELGLKRREYKEIKISSILKERYGIVIQPENVKIIAMRQRKLREGNI